jgi:hypothetical protein
MIVHFFKLNINVIKMFIEKKLSKGENFINFNKIINEKYELNLFILILHHKLLIT